MAKLPDLRSFTQLKDQYELLLFDAYGVLVDASGPLPGAVQVISELNASGHSYYIITNGSMKPAKQSIAYLQNMGIQIQDTNYLSSGGATRNWIEHQYSSSIRVCLLGPPSCHFLIPSQHQLVSCEEEFDLLVIGNQDGYEILPTIGMVISTLYRMIDQGRTPTLALPNPDLIYPAGNGNYGITSGMIAGMIESALKLRFRTEAPRFLRFGKPETLMFEDALKKSGLDKTPEKALMIGDQVDTDILGGLRAGCHTALIGTGIGAHKDQKMWHNSDVQATYILDNLL